MSAQWNTTATTALLPSLDFTFTNIFKKNTENARILTKIKTKEHNNRQNFNICIRNLDTNKETQKAKCIEEFQAQYMTMKKKTGGY